MMRNTFKIVFHKKIYPNYWDVLAILFTLAIITLLSWTAKQMATPYQLGQAIPIFLQPKYLPFYAARTVVRMLIALIISLLFTFVFATWAAKSKRAERIIIPIIDVLQSVPILGFLSVTVTGFIALFPDSLLGPECAAIFVIFTSQAWNMALGFYQTVRSVPNEIREAARMFHLSAWQCFWRIDVPYSMPGLLWNTMASMSAGWFFVVASEAFTVSNQEVLLPGIGSYIAVAIKSADLHAIIYAILAMLCVIIVYDQILFRPVVAWAEKFKAENQASDKIYESWVINLFIRTRLVRYLGGAFTRVFDAFVNLKLFTNSKAIENVSLNYRLLERIISILYFAGIFLLTLSACFFLGEYIYRNIHIREIEHVFILGLITALRVFILIIISSIIWVPIGIWIGLRPRVAQLAQPIAQILSAFPANLLYPFMVLFIIDNQLNPNIWLTPLMMLGAQWYILFNVIAGTSTIPKDLLQVVDNLGVLGWLRWSRLLLPSVFPYYITGAITAAGGAWNASILAEAASWGDHTVMAVGLGAYITQSTSRGDFQSLALGVGMMCLLVLLFNRLIWRPIYTFAINRFSLE